MRCPIISCAAALAFLTTIATAGPWYLFVEGGTTRFSNSVTTLTDFRGEATETVGARDNSAGSFSAGLGWEWSRHVAIEVTGFHTGETVETWNVIPAFRPDVETWFVEKLRRRASGYHAHVVLSTATWRRFTAGLSLGGGRLRIVEEPEPSIPRNVTLGVKPPPQNRQWTFCPVVGARVGYTLSDHLGLRLKYERYLPDDLETWSPDLELGIFSLGATWKF